MTSGFLLDTSAFSLLAPGRPELPADVADRLRLASDRLYVPTIALAEIRQGICKLRRQGAASRADTLDGWLLSLRYVYGDRVLPFDVDAAEAAGEIADAAMAVGRHPGFADVAIAGTARSRNLAVITENLRHFEPLGVTAFHLAGMP